MTINITGPVRQPDGSLFINSIITIQRMGGVVSQSSSVLLPDEFTVMTDGIGEVDFEIEAGQYQAYTDGQRERRIRWDFNVPETPASRTFESCVEAATPTITPDLVLQAEAAADRAEAAAVNINTIAVDNTAALKALDTVQWDAALNEATQGTYVWTAGDWSAQITAADPRYIAPDSAPTGASGAWVYNGGVWNGAYSAAEGVAPHRIAGRVFGGAAAGFGGQWGAPASMTGLDPLARSLHNWAFRDGGMIYDDHAGSMAIVGHSQSSREGEWPGSPANDPAAIGVSGFVINDQPGGFNPAWGGYFDAVRLNSGFTVGAEITMANAGGESTPTPFNLKTGGSQGGITAWLASGAGLDVAWPEYDRVNDTAAYIALLTSFRSDGGLVAWANSQAYIIGRTAADGATRYVCLVAHTAPATGTFADYRTANPTHWQVLKSGAWVFSTAYVVGDLATDTVSGTTFRCTTAHTSPASGAFSAERLSNPARWKQLTGAKSGIVIANGAVTENSDGSDLHFAMQMPDRHMIAWFRDEAGTPVQSSFIWAKRATAGSGLTGISFDTNLIDFTATSGIRADAARIGGTVNSATISRGTGAADTLNISNPGASVILFSTAGAEVCRMDSAGFRLPTGKAFLVNNQQVIGARQTGWAAATGTAARTTFDTATVTTAQLAERVKALIDNLLTHGMIGA